MDETDVEILTTPTVEATAPSTFESYTVGIQDQVS